MREACKQVARSVIVVLRIGTAPGLQQATETRQCALAPGMGFIGSCAIVSGSVDWQVSFECLGGGAAYLTLATVVTMF